MPRYRGRSRSHYLLKTILTQDIGWMFYEDDMIGTVHKKIGLTDDEVDNDDEDDE